MTEFYEIKCRMPAHVAYKEALSLKDHSLVCGGMQIDATVRFYGGGILKLGKNVQIDAFVVIVCTEEMEIGDGTRICSHCSLHSGPKLIIGQNCEISAGVKIYTHSDYYPVIGEKYGKPVIIGNGINLGANVVVLPDVMMADNVAVGAQSLVTQDLPRGGWIYAGIPARPLKERERKREPGIGAKVL